MVRGGSGAARKGVLEAALEYASRVLEAVARAGDSRDRTRDRRERSKDVYSSIEEELRRVKEERARLALELAKAYSGEAAGERLRLAERHLDSLRRWACRALPWGGVFSVDARVVEGSRLLVGASSGVLQGVFEVGLAWDHVLDLPYIPGSSLKGAMRASAEAHLKDSHEDVFGGEGRAGCLTVFDAYPVGLPGGRAGALLEPDVVTPHYYEGGVVRGSELEAKPVPVVHVSIAPGVVFRFVAVHQCSGEVLQRLSRALAGKGINASGEAALAALMAAALFNGVGARTGKGYGILKPERVAFGCTGR